MEAATIDAGSITQMVFSIGVSWYLLTVFSKKLDNIASEMKTLHNSIQNTQEKSLAQSTEVKEMFSEIKNLIKETSVLVQATSESVKIHSELTRHTLDRLDRLEQQKEQNH